MTAEAQATPEATHITRDQYIIQLTALLAECQSVRRTRGWCDEWAATGLQLSPHFRRDPADRNRVEVHVPEPDLLPEGIFAEGKYAEYLQKVTGYAGELRLVRGRVLQLARDQVITPAEANQVLRAGGLDPHPQEAVQRLVGIAYLPNTIYVDTTEHHPEIRARVVEAFQRFLTEVSAVMDSRTGMTFAPGQLRLTDHYDRQPDIPARECSRLLPRRS